MHVPILREQAAPYGFGWRFCAKPVHIRREQATPYGFGWRFCAKPVPIRREQAPALRVWLAVLCEAYANSAGASPRPTGLVYALNLQTKNAYTGKWGMSLSEKYSRGMGVARCIC